MEPTPPDLVIGVAGHIDHGKTALVRALTGIDTDRLPEEKARGITIELGFAHASLPSGRRLSVVDMPGHQRFVRAMIAGAGGVDGVLLVVAGNEGVMPQTREHLAIASLLGVRGGVVALSKADLVSEELLGLAEEEVREVLAGTPLEGAAIVPVSAHTGAGLDRLKAALDRCAPTSRAPQGPALLPIDRVFVRKGFGVVVTGTLVSGTLHDGDTLVAGPLGVAHETRELRVRGLQIHGAVVHEARAGTRVAVNVAGIEADELPRGAWLFRAGEVALSQAFDARVRWLPGTRRALARRSRLELAVGAAHTPVSVSLLEGDEVEPGGDVLARLTTQDPVALRPGERFVLRGPPALAGYGSTVGGGEVLRPVAERARKRSVALERAQRVAGEDTDVLERARVEAEAAGPRGLSPAMLAARTGISPAPEELKRAGLVPVTAERWVLSGVIDAVGQKVLQGLSAHHGAQPASRGLELRTLRQPWDDGLFGAALLSLVAAKKVEQDGELVFRMGWRPKDPDAIPHLRALEAAIVPAGLTPPRPEELAAGLKVPVTALEPALKRLVERGTLTRINAELYASTRSLEDLERRLVAWLEARGTIDAQGFKELTGATRKWAIPLAEFFDGKKVTLRVGDVRKLRGR